MPEVPGRLPRSFVPSRYDLHLEADPKRVPFSGRLSIRGRMVEATRTLTLNGKRLRVTEAAAVQKGRVRARVTHLAKREEILLTFSRPLAPGAVRVEIAYRGRVSSSMEGLYLSRDGAEVCLATQCEATDARAIFPCLDEPDRKARFAWKVTAPAGLQVLANGALERRRVVGNKEVWTFRPTAPMASYLAAVAIGPFAGTPERTARGVPFRVWALGGKAPLGKTGRDFAARLLPWYHDYFGQPYAFGKYDQVAVPSFAFGAMENAGLVVFRASLILVDEKTAAWDDRRDLSLVVAHEFAHMWFGDLVTMAWW
ncbi:MAG: M1 family metallopeptidase, partial [Thermoplasmatota archaeon]